MNQCLVPFCKNERLRKEGKCPFHRREYKNILKFKPAIPFWAVKYCPKHGFKRFHQCYVTYKNNISRYYCRECGIDYDRKRDRPYERVRNERLKTMYGIGNAEYDAFLLSQNGQCAICFTTVSNTRCSKFSVDHCHSTKKVRGLLCQKCNMGLGNFKDSIQNLERAIEYLRPHQ